MKRLSTLVLGAILMTAAGSANFFWDRGLFAGQSGPHNMHGHTKQSDNGAASGKLLPADGAAVKIISPKKEQIFQSDQIPLQFNLTKGKRGHHVHAYVDGELMGMFESEKGALTGIKPGKHVLELRVVAEDHKSELNATDRVPFTVK